MMHNLKFKKKNWEKETLLVYIADDTLCEEHVTDVYSLVNRSGPWTRGEWTKFGEWVRAVDEDY